MARALERRRAMCAVICSLIGYEVGAAIGEIVTGVYKDNEDDEENEDNEDNEEEREDGSAWTSRRRVTFFPGGPLRRSVYHAWTSLHDHEVNVFGRPLPRRRGSRIKVMIQDAVPLMLGVLGSLLGDYVGLLLNKGALIAAMSLWVVMKDKLNNEELENTWRIAFPELFAFDTP